MNKANWTYKPMGEVGTFLRGKSILKSDFIENGMPCIHYGQVHTKFGVSVSQHISEISEDLYKKSIIASPGNTIIVITSEDLEGSCKSTDWLGDYDVAVSAHAAVYKHKFAPKFIPYYLRSRSFFIEKEKYARGFKVMEIKPTDLAKIPIPIPPHDAQIDIVEELDGINDSISMLHMQVKDLDDLAQSIFYTTFGDPRFNSKAWPIVKLGNIAETTIGLTYKPENVTDNEEGTIVLRSCNIQNSQLAFEDIVRVNIPIKEEKYVRDGDILMCSRNGSFKLVGKVAIIKGLSERMSYGAFMTIIRSDYNPYLFAFFKTPAFREYMSLGKTSTVNQVTVNMLRNISLPFPPISLQKTFALEVAKIEESKTVLNSQIKELQKLLAARMQYWFD